MAQRHDARRGHKHTESDITDLGTYLTDAPSDGSTYGRKDGAWEVASGGGGGLANIVEDLSPQLGANLDMNGFTIASIAEANLLDKTATETVSGAYTLTGGLTLTTSNLVAGTINADFGAITGTSYGGITEANLLDKAATETVSGAYTLTGGLTLTTNPLVAGTINADFDALTATSYGGIVEANLLDKSATETISGAYTMTGGLTLTTGNIVAGTIDADFGALTATSYDGVLAANLLDKTATETISANWTISADSFTLNDDKQLILGSGADMSLKFNSGANEIQFSGIGTTNWSVILAVTDTMILATANAGVALFHNGSQKFVTASDGIDVVGDVGGTTIGGITSANLLDKSATETIAGAYTITGGLTLTTNPLVAGTVAADFDALTATSYGGVLEANLLDKSATETVSGAYTFSAAGLFTGNTLAVEGASPRLRIEETDATAEEQNWEFLASGDVFSFSALNDARSIRNTIFSLGRTGAAPGTLTFAVNVGISGALTATTFGGITSANLLDKSATETISGAYTMTGGLTLTTGNLVAGTIDADFDVLTATSYDGVVAANLLDKAATETISGDWTHSGDLKANVIYLAERTNADADISNSGQVFVKSTTPEELWFASDDGVEHHVAGGSLAETFGKNKTVNEGVISSTTMQNDDDLGIAVTSGRFYTVIMVLEVNTLGAPSGGFKFQFTVPSSSVGSFSWNAINSGNSAYDEIGGSAAWTTAQTSISVPTSGTTILVLHGTFTAGGDGTLQLQWAQNSSTTADTRILKGSSLNLISG